MAQHHSAAVFPPFGSGTAWLPDAAVPRGFHVQVGTWRVMLHGSVFVQFVQDFGQRGNYQLGSVNWVMVDASRPLGGGTLRARTMSSAEFLTLTRAGYPQLLQVAQPYRGGTLTDRMHPHELLSEAAIVFERPLREGLGWFVYVAAIGEPALGPVAYLHRPSAANDPTAPLGHHAQDVTHETFGVATVGLFTHRTQLEASVFNSAHPNEVRTNFDYSGARLNSFSARLTINPDERWSIAGSGAYIAASTGAHGHGALQRWVLSVMHVTGPWATSFVWGANRPADTRRLLPSVLVETNVELDARHSVFGRAEYLTRTAEELALVGSVSEEVKLGSLAFGYARRVGVLRRVELWLVGRGHVDFVPEELRLFYGSRTPTGVLASLQLRAPLTAAH